MENIRLKTSDGQVFVVDIALVQCSATLRAVLSNRGPGASPLEPILLPDISAKTLGLVITWVKNHRDDAMQGTCALSTWDMAFLGALDLEDLLNLQMAANYLVIKGLFEQTCKTVASVMNGKSVGG
ncbi:hypothetical protein KR222_007575 [Zaprionus bogoriensis]|nr:hypothetical protein KR222_007575 [Zaprionus bogoriensis]